jgi:uncharacterized repeat protein (TIGR03803 family)
VLYEFGATDAPMLPSYEGIIARGRDGNLYTTSPSVNSGANSTAFKITPGGEVTVLNYFIEGNVTESGLTLGTDGNFYGTTEQAISDAGEVFKMTPSGVVNVLHTFTNGSDGGGPMAPPIEGIDGNYYGTTNTGANGWGTVYKVTPSGTFSTIYSFVNFAGGSKPWAPLAQGADGNFYAVTYEGGTSGQGVFYKITPRGQFTLLTNFSGIGGTVGPLVQGNDGNFYGTSSLGGSAALGSVFKITPSGKLTILHNFTGSPDGSTPNAGLVLGTDGNSYSVTNEGGSSTNCQSGCGTIFQMTPTEKLTILHSFDHTDGYLPKVTLIQHTNGIFYGDTEEGGTNHTCTTGCGVFFSLNMGLKPFVRVLLPTGKVGTTVEILGQGFSGTSGVSFHGTAASFHVVPNTYLTATVPSGATTGAVQVTTSEGVLTSNTNFRVTPQIQSFSPPSGPVGMVVTIKGVSLSQTTKVTFGSVAATDFTVNSDTEVTATVPTTAKTGKIGITTPGGTVLSTTSFTGKSSLRNKVYKIEVARYPVASARLYSDGDEDETSRDGAALAACTGHVE